MKNDTKEIADNVTEIRGALRALANEAANAARLVDGPNDSDAEQVLAYLDALQDAASFGAHGHDASPNRDDDTMRLAGAVLLVCREAVNAVKTGEFVSLYLAEQKLANAY